MNSVGILEVYCWGNIYPTTHTHECIIIKMALKKSRYRFLKFGSIKCIAPRMHEQDLYVIWETMQITLIIGTLNKFRSSSILGH